MFLKLLLAVRSPLATTLCVAVQAFELARPARALLILTLSCAFCRAHRTWRDLGGDLAGARGAGTDGMHGLRVSDGARPHASAKAAPPSTPSAVVGSRPAAADRSLAWGSFFLESLSANFFGGAGGFFISGEGQAGVERTPSRCVTVWLAPWEGARRRLAGGGDELRGRAHMPKVRPSGAHSGGTG